MPFISKKAFKNTSKYKKNMNKKILYVNSIMKYIIHIVNCAKLIYVYFAKEIMKIIMLYIMGKLCQK